MTQCQVQADSSVTDANFASVPGDVWAAAHLENRPGGRVLLTVGTESAYVVPVLREAGQKVVYVMEGTLNLHAKGGQPKSGKLEQATDTTYRRHLLFHTTDGKIVLGGLVLAAIPLATTGFNSLSLAGVVHDIGNSARAVLTASAQVLQIAGLILVVWRGWLSGKFS